MRLSNRGGSWTTVCRHVLDKNTLYQRNLLVQQALEDTVASVEEKYEQEECPMIIQ